MSDVEIIEQDQENIAIERPAAQSYSETVRWLIAKGYFKSELSAKIFLISISVVFFLISFSLMYLASTYISTQKTLETIDLQR